ncbi:MAG: DNA gyrase inhibitor YacG [Planctomycetia bacterium]|nr:DNA gyrase inhibitor YacG [Planctomycetia bacterium]
MKFKCRYCHRVVSVQSEEEAPFSPFCSDRCKMAELNRWFDGTYGLSRPADEEAEESPPRD